MMIIALFIHHFYRANFTNHATIIKIINRVLIKSVRGFKPSFGKDCYFAENCTIIGDVIIGDQASVWFQAVIRGDVNSIRIGNKVNIQIFHRKIDRMKHFQLSTLGSEIQS